MRALWYAAPAAVMVGAFGAAAIVLAQVAPVAQATAEIRDASNRVLASASLREGRNEVLIAINFPREPVLSGTHAIHITDTGRCDPPEFATSANIFNPFNKKHGRQNPEGTEVGDLPNVNFSTGLTSYNTSAIGATLGPGPGSLLSPSRSIVIYSGQDDQQTEPDGNPGSPIGCGVIVAAGAQPSPKPAAAPPTVAVAKPIASPAAVAKPVAAVASPSPIAALAAPTPILILPTSVPLVASAQSSAAAPGTLNLLLIAVLGLALIGAGVMLRRPQAR
jgi:superoxide dismutase, Cu-Zn family